MARALKNWLDAYMDYTRETESATAFHKWVGRSVIAACLRKKVRLSLGRINVYPNMYVVLVAEPGLTRKSQAISFGTELLGHIKDVRTSADAITKEALIQELGAKETRQEEELPNGDRLTHASLSVISKEFESFLGQKKENTKMLVLLTDLFDAQEMPWQYRTKGSGTDIIPSVFLNILGATTPESLASCLPVQAIGGGLTSRILFVYATKKAKKVPKLVLSPAVLALKEQLIRDLHHIARVSGTYEMDEECDKKWYDWYMAFDEQDPERLCPEPIYTGWYSRKPLYILKLAQIHAAAESSSLIITWEHLSRAVKDVESVEPQMSKVFSSIGRSTVTAEVDMFINAVRSRGPITEEALMAMFYRDMDSDKFNNVSLTAVRTGLISRQRQGNKLFYFVPQNKEHVKVTVKR